MSNYNYPNQLPHITHLFSRKLNIVKSEIDSLRVDQVRDDEDVEQLINGISRRNALRPVTFGEIEMASHWVEQRRNQYSFQNPFPHTQDIYHIQVRVPFDGSPELFSYFPDNTMVGGERFYYPSGSRFLELELILGRLDRDLAMREARNLLNGTYNLISINNNQAAEWSERLEARVREMVNDKRQQLLNFYK